MAEFADFDRPWRNLSKKDSPLVTAYLARSLLLSSLAFLFLFIFLIKVAVEGIIFLFH